MPAQAAAPAPAPAPAAAPAAPATLAAEAERRPETIMAFWIIWMPCWTAAPPVSAEARLGAWKHRMAISSISTQ